MKKILLSFALFASWGLLKTNAQSCSIGIPNITNVVTSSTADSCFVKFDLSFPMKNNNGNKTIGIDLWQKNLYVSPAYSNVPSGAELANALGSIVIDNNSTGSPISITYRSAYPSGSSVRMLATGLGTR